MKGFHFTLEAVLTLRQRQEQKAMELYAQALLGRHQALEKLAAVQRDLETGFRELREQMARGCTASHVSQAQDYHRSLAKRRDECALNLATAERRVNAALQAMLSARQQREIVDKYFDKQKARHGREVARNEQKFLDDLAGRRSNSVLTWNANELPT
jgi:flagellar export protein FliJ